MTTPRRTGLAEHWCVGVARRAGWPGADLLTIRPGAGVADAWGAVMQGCRVSEQELTAAIARHYRLEPVRWELATPAAMKLLPEKLARRHVLFPLHEDYKALVVATADPNDLAAEQTVEFSSGRKAVFRVAPPSAILTAIDAGYAPEDAATSLLRAAGEDLEHAVRLADESTGPESIRAEEAQAAPVVSLTNLIIRDGVFGRASDIHIEPGRTAGIVRFRIDGVMREYLQLPMAVFNRIVSRIKVLGQMDIADRMRPQDGRARVRLGEKTVDLRLSTVPTRESEKAVIRILDTASTKKLHEIGFPKHELDQLRALLSHRDGIVILTGPTGSGKTTTLYGAIQELATGAINITTIEDPVEYEVGGITQIQVETKRGVSFAGTLRAVLRQDPDVIFVGEIRDAETAEVATHAALTGHLVLTTLHTNDAVGIVQRLGDLGLDRGTVASAVRGAVAQRLVRRLCVRCRVPATAPLTADEVRLKQISGIAPTNRAVGCDVCGGTGYFGRMAIPEVFTMTPELEEQVASDVPVPALQRTARGQGMRLLVEVGLDYVRDGETSLQEIERIVGFSDLPAPTVVSKGRVMTVDDDPVVQAMLKALLEKEGLEVVPVTDGMTALEVAARPEHLDLIVLDLGLPRLDGRQVMKRLRAAEATRQTPIIILTGLEDTKAEMVLMDEGADDYLRKPIEPARFIARCRAVMRRRGAD